MRALARAGIALLPMLGGASVAEAGEASDVVRLFYEQPGLELEPEGRERFVDPALKVLLQNDAIRQGGDEGCLDPALPFNDTEFDLAEVASTLDLGEVVSGAEATVVASFTSEGAMQRVQWHLRREGDGWMVYDIMSMTKDWSLSAFQCE